MEIRPRHGEHELATATQHARHLGQDVVDAVDVLEHGVGEHPVEGRVGLRDGVAAGLVNGRIDAQNPRLRSLGWIGIDADHHTLTRHFE